MRVIRILLACLLAFHALTTSFFAFKDGFSSFGFFMVGLPLVIAYALWPKADRPRQAMNADAQNAEKLAFFNQVNTERRLPEPTSATILDRKDAIVLAACPARLYEKVGARDPRLKGPKAKVTTDGVQTTAALVASGELAITTTSLAFVAGAKNFDVKLAKLLSVQSAESTLLIAAQGRSTPLIIEVRNPLLWKALIVNTLRIKPTSRELPPGFELEP